MSKPSAIARRLLAFALTVGALAPATGCDDYDSDDDGGQFACVYDYSVYRTSEYGSSFDTYEDNCVTVASRDACDAYTDSSTECHGGSCADYSYTNVDVYPGSCDTFHGNDYEADDDPPSYGGGGSCEWTNDGECDEPEGTDLCPEGSDTNDCATTCRWTYDGECDEPEGTGLCPEGSDAYDC